MWPTGVQRWSVRIGHPVLDRTFAWFLRRLRALTAAEAG